MKIELNKGDIIYTGKFLNKKTTINDFGVDDKGQPTINGKKVLRFRVEKFMNQQSNEPPQDYKESKQENNMNRYTQKKKISPTIWRTVTKLVQKKFKNLDVIEIAKSDGCGYIYDKKTKVSLAKYDPAYETLHYNVDNELLKNFK